MGVRQICGESVRRHTARQPLPNPLRSGEGNVCQHQAFAHVPPPSQGRGLGGLGFPVGPIPTILSCNTTHALCCPDTPVAALSESEANLRCTAFAPLPNPLRHFSGRGVRGLGRTCRPPEIQTGPRRGNARLFACADPFYSGSHGVRGKPGARHVGEERTSACFFGGDRSW